MAQAARYLTPQAVASIGRLPLLARQVVEGFITGLHGSPFHGFSAEFAEHRKYSPGDALKDLDWCAYARTDRYYVKRYREETNLRCRLVVDASGSMRFASSGVSKLEYACCLGACLAYLAIRQRDAVGLTLCAGEASEDLPPAARPAQLSRILMRLEEVRAGGAPPVARALEEAAEKLRRRGLVVVLSDLLDSEDLLARAMRHLRHRRHEVILFHLLDPAEERLPYRQIHEFVDLETGEAMMVDPQAIRDDYVGEINAFRNRIRRLASDCGIDYVPICTDEPYEKAFPRYLVRRARG